MRLRRWSCSRPWVGRGVLEVGEEFEDVEEEEDDVLADDLGEFLVGVHDEDGVVPAEGEGVDHDGVGVALDLVVLVLLLEVVLSDLVGLHVWEGTFSLVMISSSSRLRWNMISLSVMLA